MTERHEVEHAVHVAQTSWAPPVIAAGIFFMNSGFIFGIGPAIFGIIVFVFGIALWIREDIKKWREESDGDGH